MSNNDNLDNLDKDFSRQAQISGGEGQSTPGGQQPRGQFNFRPNFQAQSFNPAGQPGAGGYYQQPYNQYGQYGQYAGNNSGAAANQPPAGYQGGYQGGYPDGYQGQGQGGYQAGYQGGYQGGQGGYQAGSTRGGYQNSSRGGYQGRGGYNNYNNNSYGGAYNQEPQQEEKQTLTLEEYQKSKTSFAAAPKPTLNTKSSLITGTNKSKVFKIGGDSKPSPSPSPKPAAKAEPQAETKTETKAETKTEPKKEAAKTETKKDSEKTDKTEIKAPEKIVDAEALIKEQELEVDKEVVNDLFGDVKEHMSVIFMGHVDAGKSTMGGNILYLTGAVDKRTIEKYEREAKDAGRQGWYLSWVMDTNKEERDQGKTVEVGRSFFETEKRRYTILDAPGHKMYVPSMIGGASQADVGILVISARKGEYETGFERGGQTREHAVLAKTQGVNKLIVAVNKMDDPTVEWSKDRYDECTGKLGVFLRANGYNLKTDVHFMPVSGYTGAGLKDRVPKDKCDWYDGPSLLEYLDNLKVADRKVNAPFMLPVSGKAKDLGTIVEGKIESGNVKKGDQLLMMPNKANVEVMAIYNETEAEVAGAISGEQVRLKLRNIEEEDVQIGYVLTSTSNPVHTVTKFEAQVAIVELKSILSTGYSCVMHIHTAIEEVTFTALLHKLEKGTNRKSRKPPAFAKRGMKIIAQLETVSPVCAETFDDYPQLGRFTLRDQGQTIAIGKITKILN